jgi:hypothetical protein
MSSERRPPGPESIDEESSDEESSDEESSDEESSDEESSDEESSCEDRRVSFFIPALGIDLEVLVFYLKRFLGHDSAAEPGQHPKVRSTCANSFSVLTTNRTRPKLDITRNLDMA